MAQVVCNKLLLRTATTGAAGTEAANQSQPLGNLNFLFSNWIGRRSPLLFTSFCFSFSFFIKFSYPGLLWFYWEINFPFSDLTGRTWEGSFFILFPIPISFFKFILVYISFFCSNSWGYHSVFKNKEGEPICCQNAIARNCKRL